MTYQEKQPRYTPAEAQFNTSSAYPLPTGFEAWKIRNDYPAPKPKDLSGKAPPDTPWLAIDPTKNPEHYLNIIREYCFEGMIGNDFIPQKNRVRDWYHAPWMHYGDAGREPLHGLTSERYCPKNELSATQNRITQTWAVGFFNSPAASVFSGMWKDPNSPKWTEDIKFPVGSLIFKLLFTDATDLEVPSMVGAPGWDAVIAVQSDNPDPSIRNKLPRTVRILQMDIATRDDRSLTGWIFGTFMYNGRLKQHDPWYRLIPVGLQWGNDPEVTQAAFDAGARPVQRWINPEATHLRKAMHGSRPFWGWNERLNGPADNFISACASCHSTAEWPHRGVDLVPEGIVQTPDGKWVPKDDKEVMQYFQNIPCGTPFTKGSVSGDYSLQLMIGYDNFMQWNMPPSERDKIPLRKRLQPQPRQGRPLEY